MLFDSIKVIRPPIINKCIIKGCSNTVVFHCSFHVWNLCEVHKSFHKIHDNKCKIFEGNELWKQCHQQQKYCEIHREIKDCWCKSCSNKLICMFCYAEFHSRCNPNGEDFHFPRIVMNLFFDIKKYYPDDPIVKMIEDNLGISDIISYKQIQYFIKLNHI